MKAKDYAEKIIAATTYPEFEDAVTAAIKGICDEFFQVAKARNIKLADAIAATILDFDRKWRNVIGFVHAKNEDAAKAMIPDGFMKIIELHFEKVSKQEWQLVQTWINARKRNGGVA